MLPNLKREKRLNDEMMFLLLWHYDFLHNAAKSLENPRRKVNGGHTRPQACIEHRVRLFFPLTLFVLVPHFSVLMKRMKWTFKQGSKSCQRIPRERGARTWYNVLLVVVGVGNCADRVGGFGIPRLRFFVILAKVVHFLILLQVSVEERGKCSELQPDQCTERKFFAVRSFSTSAVQADESKWSVVTGRNDTPSESKSFVKVEKVLPFLLSQQWS